MITLFIFQSYFFITQSFFFKILTKDTPWSVFCEYFEEKRLWCQGMECLSWVHSLISIPPVLLSCCMWYFFIMDCVILGGPIVLLYYNGVGTWLHDEYLSSQISTYLSNWLIPDFNCINSLRQVSEPTKVECNYISWKKMQLHLWKWNVITFVTHEAPMGEM